MHLLGPKIICGRSIGPVGWSDYNHRQRPRTCLIEQQEGQPAPEATVFPHVALAEVLAEVFTQVRGNSSETLTG